MTLYYPIGGPDGPMIPGSLASILQSNQELLWLLTVALDLSLTLLMYRLFGRSGLTAAIVLAILLANLQGPKLTIIFGLETSLGVIFYSSIFFCTDLIGEKHGRAAANLAVLTGFGVSVIIVLMMSLSLMYLPSTEPDTAEFSSAVHSAFTTILSFTPRFVFGSLLAYLVSQSLDVWLFHKLRDLTGGKHLWLRNNGSTMISQAVDTALYSLVVWWGTVSLTTAISLGLAKYVFKLVIAVLDTPFIYWARGWKPRGWFELGPAEPEAIDAAHRSSPYPRSVAQ